MYANVFSANLASSVPMVALALSSCTSSDAALWRRPIATNAPSTNRRSPSSVAVDPSASVITSGPTLSSSAIPASRIMSGPRFGYRPVIDAAAFTTATIRRSASASAATRSRSAWSITAISPGLSCLVRSFVRRPTRTVPVTGRDGGPDDVAGPAGSVTATRSSPGRLRPFRLARLCRGSRRDRWFGRLRSDRLGQFRLCRGRPRRF
jgi:hypothetical protein